MIMIKMFSGQAVRLPEHFKEDTMTNRSFTPGWLCGMLTCAGVLLAMIPLVSVPASAESAAVTADYTMDFTGAASWRYVDKNGDEQVFDASCADRIIEARDWTWYGNDQGGTEPNSLKIWSEFSFDTTAQNAMTLPAGSTVVFQYDAEINAKQNCIYSDGDLTLTGDPYVDPDTGMTKLLTLTFGDSGLYSKGDLTVDNIDLYTDPDSVESYDNAVLANGMFRLQDCYFYAGDAWNGTNVVNCTNYNISRGTIIDIPFSYFTSISGYGNYIADISYVENAKPLDINIPLERGKSYINTTATLCSADRSGRMRLDTAEFKVRSGDLFIYEKALSDPDSKGDYKTLGGKTYKIDLSELVYGDPDNYRIGLSCDSPDKDQYSYEIKDGAFEITVPNKELDDSLTVTVGVTDDKYEYSSNKTKSFNFVVGQPVKTNRLGIGYNSNAGGTLKDHVDISLTHGDTELPLCESSGYCYFIPAGFDCNLSLLPKDGEVEFLQLGTEDIIPSIDGNYDISLDGDKELSFWFYESDTPQYVTVGISDELVRAFQSGGVTSVTVTDYLGSKQWRLDSGAFDFPFNYLNGMYIQIDIVTDGCGVTDICGETPDYRSEKKYYTADFRVSGDFTVTAPVREVCGFKKLINVNGIPPVVKGDRDVSGGFYPGVEYEILVPRGSGKLNEGAEFNGAAIEPFSEDSDGWHYRVTPVSGTDNTFICKCNDVSLLRLAKPEHGAIAFSGRLDNGRGKSSLEDGTEVYTLGTGDNITLTFTPDEGYRLASAALDGSEISVGADGAYSFMLEQLVDWTVTAKFEKIAVPSTVTVNCGESGTVTPGTKAYENGSEVVLTVTPDAGYKVKSVTLDGRAVTLTNGKFTFTVTADCTFAAEFEKLSGGSSGGSGGSGSSGGSGGSGSSGSSRPSAAKPESTPIMNGTPISWSDIAKDLGKLPGGSAEISLNGEYTVPAEVIGVIRDRKLTVEFISDSVKSWSVRGEDISAAAAADFSALPGSADKSALRGVPGVDLKVSGTTVPAELKLNFRREFAGEFANVYRLNGNTPEFIGCVKVGSDGSANVPGAYKAGEYIVMVCGFSDLNGDADNDGSLTALDASAILKDIVGAAKSANPLMCDFNGDGAVNALDASAVLKAVVGITA